MNTMAQGGALARTDIRALGPKEGHGTQAWTLGAINRAKAGDQHAMRFLFSQYSGIVHRYATSLVRDPDLAQDVTQTTFLKLLTKLDRYEPREVPFEAWLLRVTRNVALDELRRRQVTAGPPVLERDVPAWTQTADPEQETLPDALRRVPAKERKVLVLRHVLGLSPAEVARKLEMSEGTVQALHDRGRTSLRTALKDLGTGPVADRPAEKHAMDQLGRARQGASRPVVERII